MDFLAVLAIGLFLAWVGLAAWVSYRNWRSRRVFKQVASKFGVGVEEGED